jgi:hypothetical protein
MENSNIENNLVSNELKEKNSPYEFYSSKEAIKDFVETFSEGTQEEFKKFVENNPPSKTGMTEETINNSVKEKIEFYIKDINNRIAEGKSTTETLEEFENKSIPKIIEILENCRKEVVLERMKKAKKSVDHLSLIPLKEDQVEMEVKKRVEILYVRSRNKLE